jgi:hypothetical protein
MGRRLANDRPAHFCGGKVLGEYVADYKAVEHGRGCRS